MKGEKIFFGNGVDSMELSLQDKLRLIEFFEFLLDEEISKPLGQMNSEAVDNYIEILLDLQDKQVELSPKYIDEQVRKIFHPEDSTVPEAVKTTKKYFNKKKVWLVAACIAILVALFSIASFSSEKGIVDTLEDFFGTFEFIPFDKDVTIGNESYIKYDERHIYKSVEDFVNKEKIDLLCPTNITSNIERISIGDVNYMPTIGIVFEEPNFLITITLNTEIPEEIINVSDDKITINGIDYYLCIMEDVNQVQAYFMHNNNMYVIEHTDKNKLMEILNNIEEIKYEN